MIITSIKWNPHYTDRVFNGETLGRNFNYEECVIAPYAVNNNKYKCKEIIEENINTYLIKYHDNTTKRIFNPIEINFKNDK